MIEMIDNELEIENLYKNGSCAPYSKVENGHGYYGVVILNKTTDTIQCHLCGKWFTILGPHLNKIHKITADEYKKQFGLMVSQALCGKGYSEKRSLIAKDNITNNKVLKIKTYKMNGKRRKRIRERTNISMNSSAWQNKNLTCPDQIMRRYVILCDDYGKELNSNEVKKYDSALSGAIRRRYGSFSNFLIKNNLKHILHSEKFTKEAIISKLHLFIKNHNRYPYVKEFCFENGLPDYRTIIKKFGSLRRFRNEAGLGEYQKSVDRVAQ